MPEDFRPLSGRRVISIAQQLPGPYCGLLLADLGAEVVLVEQVRGGDPARVFPALFAAANRGKSSVAIDLKTAEGVEAFHRLTATADVVLEGFRPGVAARLGVDYARVAHPGLVYCSISGFGQSGPVAGLPGHDLTYQAWSGALGSDISGAPVVSPLPVADLSSALYATVGILAALSDPTGQGGYIDVSMAESVLAFNSVAVLTAQADKHDAELNEPAYGVFATADRPITLSIAHEDHFWRAMCVVLDWPDVAELRGTERRERSAPLRRRLESAIATEGAAHWLNVFGGAGVPCGPVNDAASTLQDPLFLARGAFADIGGTLYPRTPIRRDGAPTPVSGPAPALGADTERYLVQLGYDDDEIQRMSKEGIVRMAKVNE